MFQRYKNYYHLLQAVLANAIYRNPSQEMTIIGVTGTDGKTTTASLIYQILHANKMKVALLTTVSALIDGKEYDTGFHVTTPSAFALQSYLKKAKEAGVTHFVLEVTSHGLDQNRVYGIPFAIGVLTNITHEHLDYHKNYENYVDAKMILLRNARIVIINKDDTSYEMVNSKLTSQKSKVHIKNRKVITYGMYNTSDINPNNFAFKTSLIGTFNQYNCLAAATVAKEIGVTDSVIKKALQEATPPRGRQEVVYEKDFMVVVDFAHTPNSFEMILKELSEIKKGRLIHVFGSAGKRDETKRPLMGKASSTYSDIIVLTAEDPRGEIVEDIMADIQEGFGKDFYFRDFEEKIIEKDEMKTFYKIPDRQKAILFAIHYAQKGDIVVVTGKSHESSMNYGKGEVAWDEFKAIDKAIAARNE